VARLAVPRVADWCVVDILAPDGSLRRLAAVHADPTTRDVARELQRRFPPDPNAPYGVPRVLRTGKPELYTEITDALLVQITHDAEHLALLRSLGLRSGMCVPLVARERTLGALTFAVAESGRRYGAVDLALAEDLARRAALALDNAALYRQAQDAIRARDHFLSIASHELRTPVTTIKGTAQLLRRVQRRGQLDAEKLTRHLDALNAASDRMTTLTEDLLDISRLQTGQLTLRPRSFDLAALVRTVTERHQEQAGAQHRFTVDLSCEPCPIVADSDRVEQVLANLLVNAVKYSPNGGAVHVALQTSDDGVLLAVRDEGIGLPPGAAETIFAPFGRAENAIRENLPGMGLGLYISRQIAECHGGRLWAESEGEGRGTTMYLRLPNEASR
jgi:signal transduction histidine kinase